MALPQIDLLLSLFFIQALFKALVDTEAVAGWDREGSRQLFLPAAPAHHCPLRAWGTVPNLAGTSAVGREGQPCPGCKGLHCSLLAVYNIMP